MKKLIKITNFSTTITKMLIPVCLLLAIISGCSKEDECETCTAEFINVNTGETIHQEADCERVPPAEGFVFVRCMDNPDY